MRAIIRVATKRAARQTDHCALLNSLPQTRDFLRIKTDSTQRGRFRPHQPATIQRRLATVSVKARVEPLIGWWGVEIDWVVGANFAFRSGIFQDVKPPSARMLAPVTKEASGLARNATTLAISWGFP